VWVLRAGQLYQYEGNYADYVEAEAARLAEEQLAPASDAAPQHRVQGPPDSSQRKLRLELESLEREIEALEREVDEAEHVISQASAAMDVERVRTLSEGYEALQAMLSQRLADWERLSEALGEH